MPTRPRPDPSQLDDTAFCIAMLPLVSRTFVLSIEGLPESLRDAVRVGYLLCRIVDTIEDDPALDGPARTELFARFADPIADDTSPLTALDRCAASVRLSPGPEAALLLDARRVFRCFRSLPAWQRERMRGPILEMRRGMEEYAARSSRGFPIRDLPDLERYCYFVAGTVGQLLTALFREGCEPVGSAVEDGAIAFGVGLQLVNILKDVAADAAVGVCYLPADRCEAHGLPRSGLLDPAHEPARLAVVGELRARARTHLERALDYVSAWPLPEGRPVRRFCLVPLGLARQTLAVLERGETIKVSRQVVARTLELARSTADSEGGLASFVAECDRIVGSASPATLDGSKTPSSPTNTSTGIREPVRYIR